MCWLFNSCQRVIHLWKQNRTAFASEKLAKAPTKINEFILILHCCGRYGLVVHFSRAWKPAWTVPCFPFYRSWMVFQQSFSIASLTPPHTHCFDCSLSQHLKEHLMKAITIALATALLLQLIIIIPVISSNDLLLATLLLNLPVPSGPWKMYEHTTIF